MAYALIEPSTWLKKTHGKGVDNAELMRHVADKLAREGYVSDVQYKVTDMR